MTNKERQDIEDVAGILKQLDRTSLVLIKNGAELLKARQDMELDSQDKKAG